ncbi:MAG: NADH-quinone oxidoreductase subunit J [Acidobacteriota bacterium]|jgi:NADH-quinone oxidoreductase subunit J|nr:NADH-quinone oxidoreductase subunit J [Acidobacteriota bacterium]
MSIFFYIFAAITVLAALNMVLQRTPVYSALSLIVVLCSLAGVYLQLGAEFMAVIQVIVYAGAIMVLFVFVIMLLNAGHETPSHRSHIAKWLGAPLIGAFLAMMLMVIRDQFPATTGAAPAHLDGSPLAIGHLLFGNYVLPFEVTSVLILVAVLGAVVLAKKEF